MGAASSSDLARRVTLLDPDFMKLDRGVFLLCMEPARVITGAARSTAAARLPPQQRRRLRQTASLRLEAIPDEPLLPMMLSEICKEIRPQTRLLD